MDFLSNPVWQFIINSCIGIISIFIVIWIAFRRPVQIPISYEAITIEPVNGSEDEIKELIENMQVSADDETITYSCFVTFKIWNSGRESITLPEDSKPLTIAFKHGEKILDCKRLETVPNDLELSYRLDAEKILLNFPLLDPNEAIIFRVLLTSYVNYFPQIYVRVPGKKRIERANNVRMSKEARIAALLFLCVAILGYMAFTFGSSSHKHNIKAEFYFIGLTVLFLLVSLTFFLESWVSRRSAPFPDSIMLPSTLLYIYFKIFLRALPALIIFGALAAIIYALFGLRVLTLVYLMFCCLITSFEIWYMLNATVIYLFQKRKKAHNAILIGILTGLPSIAFLGLCVRVRGDIFQHW